MANVSQAQIQLVSIQVSEVSLKTDVNFDPALTASNELKINLNHRAHTINEDKKIFLIEFNLSIASDRFTLKVVFKGMFSNSFEIDKDFLDSQFVTLNAPAIVFPFLRSFVTTLTSNAGYQPIILPAINFAKALKSDS